MKTIGNYRVISKIAEGGFGRTYLAEQLILGTKVCIKHAINVSPDDELLLLFVQPGEICMWKSISHMRF